MTVVPLNTVPVPVMTRPYAPTTVSGVAVSRRPTVAIGEAGLGENTPATPVGNPDNSIATGAVYVAEAVSAMLYVTVDPGWIVQEAGHGTSPKSGAAAMVSATCTVAVRPSPRP